jgi:hypothetical protein
LSSPVFTFYAPGLIFGVTEDVGCRFHVLRARTNYRRYRGRRVPFPRFALPDWFSAATAASCPVFLFCASGLFFGGSLSVGSYFLVLHSRTRFDGTEGVGSRFHVLCFRTRFRLYQGRRVPFSCFSCPDSFSAVLRASCPVFMFCASGLIFGGTDDVRSRFHVLRAPTLFRLYLGRRVPFSCFALPDLFSAVPRASDPVFMFCAPGLIFDGTEGVMSRFLVLHSRTLFRRFRARRIPFSCHARPDSFSAVLGTLCPVFTFCASGLVSAVP